MAQTPEASAKAREIAFMVVKLLRGEAPTAAEDAATTAEGGAAAGGAAAGGAAAAPPTERQGDKLQHRLTQPAHAAAAALYAESIRGDPRRYAQHLSQCAAMPAAPKGAGYLTTGWLTLAPWHRKLESPAVRSAIRIMLGLPDPALQHVAVRCKCGRVDLSATSAVEALEHISACNRFNKLKPHNTFAKSMCTTLHTRNTRHCSSSTSQSTEQSSPAPSPSLARPCRCPVLTDGKS